MIRVTSGRLGKHHRGAKASNDLWRQVANAVAHGRIDEVAFDLEALDYAVAAAVIPACAAGAFHIRPRLWFVADSLGDGSQEPIRENRTMINRSDPAGGLGTLGACQSGSMADPASQRSFSSTHPRENSEKACRRPRHEQYEQHGSCSLADACGGRCDQSHEGEIKQ
jgi:DNA (cytosine-5)-methyltransferase 1